ncbi:hypothetical protein [Sphingomonas sp. ID0503]|uniref:hypothetical protein n=1 Tax=Sphingomonas sp. ID0503 TaxID=3399691 RepID=UPI003AFA4171
MFGLLITRDDDMLVRQWFARHAPLFEKLAVLDGSRGPLTREVALGYPNVLYARDPEGVPINDQTLRAACYALLTPFVRPGEWVTICHIDEFFYHDPARIALAHPDAPGVAWQALHILPHRSEKAAIAASITESGTYDPVAQLHHFWAKEAREEQVPEATLECRMFRVPEGGAEWGSFNGWVAPVNLPGKPLERTKAGETKIFSRPRWPRPFPTYFHYKLFNLDPSYFLPGSNHFEKSRLGTGLGGRRINSFDDCFFDEAAPWGHKNHVTCERFDGVLPDNHRFNGPGNAFKL